MGSEWIEYDSAGYPHKREQPQGEATLSEQELFRVEAEHRGAEVVYVEPVQTEGGEFQELPAANEKAQLRPSSPPATAGTAAAQACEAEMRKGLRCLYIAVDSHVADDISRRFEEYVTALRGDSLSGKGEATPDKPPVSDNPSGMYCPDCRSVGMLHCSDPEHCGGMKPMSAPDRAEELARSEWQKVDHFSKEIIRKLTIWECRKLDEIIIEYGASLLRREQAAAPPREGG